MAAKELDIVVFGATGFTGRLVCEYLHAQKIPRWAMAGRNMEKLNAVAKELGVDSSVPLIQADSEDTESLKSLCKRTAVVITTVGPYQRYGAPLVEACVDSGTDYVDLCGEPNFIRDMIDKHEKVAQTTGARIVFSAGFDSIPFDLGVWFLQDEAIRRFGKPLERVKGRVCGMQGGASGGTLASMRAVITAGIKSPSVLKLLNDPFALTPGFIGPHQPAGLMPLYDKKCNSWVIPFVMAPINTKNVHRTNFLLRHRYGIDFTYEEMMCTSLQSAAGMVIGAASKFNPFGIKGLGTGKAASTTPQQEGFYDLLFLGEGMDGHVLDVSVKGDGDPGYGSTSKMISQSALTLLETKSPGGVFTPGGLMAKPLLDRLQKFAGLTFSVVTPA